MGRSFSIRNMKVKHIEIATILFFIATLFYVNFFFRRDTSVDHPPTSDFNTILTYIPIPVQDNNETEMGIYSADVKARIRDIKNHLVYRPPLSILPFIRMRGHFIVAPKYNIAHCVVEKSMCTQMNSILCYLYDTEGFVANNRSIQTETWLNTFCQFKNNYGSWEALHVNIPSPMETTFIVREPLQRFVSAYIDKCVHEEKPCYGCNKDFKCVVERVFESMMQYSKNHSSITDRTEMVLEMSYEGRHFAPLTWYCDLWDRFEEYHFIKYGEDSASFSKTHSAVLDFFEKQGVEPEKVEHIDNALNSRSLHATKTTFSNLRQETWNQLIRSPKHLEMLSHLYYYDFIAFGFKSPFDIYYPYS